MIVNGESEAIKKLLQAEESFYISPATCILSLFTRQWVEWAAFLFWVHWFRFHRELLLDTFVNEVNALRMSNCNGGI